MHLQHACATQKIRLLHCMPCGLSLTHAQHVSETVGRMFRGRAECLSRQHTYPCRALIHTSPSRSAVHTRAGGAPARHAPGTQSPAHLPADGALPPGQGGVAAPPSAWVRPAIRLLSQPPQPARAGWRVVPAGTHQWRTHRTPPTPRQATGT